MVKVFLFTFVVTLCLLGACSRTIDACPTGMVREGDRCVIDVPTAPSKEPANNVGRDTSASRTGSSVRERDAGAEQEWEEGGVSQWIDALDASDGSLDMAAPAHLGPEAGPTPRDADVLDAERDVSATSSDAGDAGDAGASDADAAIDVARDAGDARDVELADASDASAAAVDSGIGDASMPMACTDGDLLSWRTFQSGGSLIQTVATCLSSDPRCLTRECDLSACLRGAAGVGGCVECVAEETRCTLTACASACSSSDTSDACRACACREGCIGATSACNMGNVDVCRDCRGTTCRNVSLDPALIMVILDG